MKLRYVVEYTRTAGNYSAGAPDVPGCVASAKTWKRTQRLITEALELHLRDLFETGQPVPLPRMSFPDAMADYAAVASDDPDDGHGEFGDFADTLEVTFGWVEVNVPDYAANESSAASSSVADGA